MITIEAIFADIKGQLNAKEVCLPPTSMVQSHGGEKVAFLEKVSTTQANARSIYAPQVPDMALSSHSESEDHQSNGKAILFVCGSNNWAIQLITKCLATPQAPGSAVLKPSMGPGVLAKFHNRFRRATSNDAHSSQRSPTRITSHSFSDATFLESAGPLDEASGLDRSDSESGGVRLR